MAKNKDYQVLGHYKKSDFKQMTWQEYNSILIKLTKDVSAYLKSKKINIDAVVPILRGASFPGAYLAYKLNLLTILPVQYKYFFNGKKVELRRMLFLKKNAVKTSSPTFLLVENNHCFGLTAMTAAKDLKKVFPKCKIIYAVDTMDYAYRKRVPAQATFYGIYTNETRALTDKQCRKFGVKNGSNVFPWESLTEEWTTVSGKQYKYGDVEEAIDNSKIRKVIKL